MIVGSVTHEGEIKGDKRGIERARPSLRLVECIWGQIRFRPGRL